MIYEYVKRFGEISKITIFPGTSYGHLEFKDVSAVQDLMKDMDAPNIKNLKFYEKER